MKRKTMTVWLATDRNGRQLIYDVKPERKQNYWGMACFIGIGENIFKQTWEDEPRKIEMILRDNK